MLGTLATGSSSSRRRSRSSSEKVSFTMEATFRDWLTAAGLATYANRFEEAGYYACEDMRTLSESDARCVAEEEMEMTKPHVDIFMATFTSCGIDNAKTDDTDGEVAVENSQNGISNSRLLLYGQLDSLTAMLVLRCHSGADLSRLRCLSSMEDLVEKLYNFPSSPPIHWTDRLQRATLAGGNVVDVTLRLLPPEMKTIAHSKLVGGPSSVPRHEGSGAASIEHPGGRAAGMSIAQTLSEALNCAVQRQQEAALRAQAREAARKAVADGLPNVRAQAALDECYTLGMTSAEEPLVAQLEAIWVESSGALKATHRRRDQESWENAAGFHFTTRTKDGGAI